MESLVGTKKRGLAFIVSAPAGTGKTTLIEMLTVEFSDVIKNISFTTRKPRHNEVDGVDYHFINKEEFEKKIANEEFLEYVSLYGEYYGTSKKWIEANLEKGTDVFLVIDTQGARILRNMLKGQFPAVFVFVLPPSLETLRSRLEKRATDSAAEINKRLSIAELEIQAAADYDYNIVNDDLDTAYQILRSIVIAEEHRVLKRRL